MSDVSNVHSNAMPRPPNQRPPSQHPPPLPMSSSSSSSGGGGGGSSSAQFSYPKVSLLYGHTSHLKPCPSVSTSQNWVRHRTSQALSLCVPFTELGKALAGRDLKLGKALACRDLQGKCSILYCLHRRRPPSQHPPPMSSSLSSSRPPSTLPLTATQICFTTRVSPWI